MLNENEVQLASLAVREIRVSIAYSLLHPFGSPPVRRSIEKAYHCLHELLLIRPRITLDFEGERPRVEQSDLEEGVVDSTHVLYEILRSHGIRKITFVQGLTLDELTSFFSLLKPRFLPDEKTAIQALKENPVKNVGVNEWEPPENDSAPADTQPPAQRPTPVEAVASSATGPASITFDASEPLPVAPDTEEDLLFQEAEASLERFIEVVNELGSEPRRAELTRRLSEVVRGDEETPAPPESSGLDWNLITQELLAVRDGLPGASPLRSRLEGVLKKLPVSEALLAARLDAAPTAAATPTPAKEPPPGLDVSFSAAADENPSQLLNPAKESESDAALRAFLVERRVDRIIPAWVVIWNGVFSGAESIQTLCLRHLSRLDWEKLPKPLQAEGFTHLENFLKAHWAESLRLEALDRLDAWLRSDKEAGRWDALLPRTVVIKGLVADPSTPGVLKTRALTFLKSLFPRQALESNYRLLGTPGDEKACAYLRAAGPLATTFLREHLSVLDPTKIDAEEAGRLAVLAKELEAVGERPLERIMDRLPGERGARILLALSRFNPFPKELVEPFRLQVAQSSPELRGMVLDFLEANPRKDLHGWAVELLADNDLGVVRRALHLLGRMQIDGASRHVVGMLESREFPRKDQKDEFWVEACQVLGDMSDPMAIKPLMEWAQAYGLLEKRKEKTLLVRRAAIQALGRFRSHQVKNFLEKLINEGDAAVIDVASEAHEKVVARLEQAQDQQPSGMSSSAK